MSGSKCSCTTFKSMEVFSGNSAEPICLVNTRGFSPGCGKVEPSQKQIDEYFDRWRGAVATANVKTESIHTLILGAGTSGLAAGYALTKAGVKPVILEKDSVPGGLFRSIHRGDFIVDIGRKELYNRIAKVDSFWSELLGTDYQDICPSRRDPFRWAHY